MRPVIRFGEIIVDLLKFQFIRRNHGFAGKCFILFFRRFWHLPVIKPISKEQRIALATGGQCNES